MSLRDERLPLDRVSLETLDAIDPSWFRSVGTAAVAWTEIGKTILILAPSKETLTGINATFVKRTNELIDDDIDLELTDDRIDMMMNLAESVLLLRQRLFDASTAALERVSKDV